MLTDVVTHLLLGIASTNELDRNVRELCESLDDRHYSLVLIQAAQVQNVVPLAVLRCKHGCIDMIGANEDFFFGNLALNQHLPGELGETDIPANFFGESELSVNGKRSSVYGAIPKVALNATIL